MIIYFGALTFIFGLILGSFLNCTAIRIARKQDWVKGKSHCMHCGHDLGALDLIPVISYVSTGGKCRYCRQKISPRYPLTEIIFGLLTLGLYLGVLARPLGAWLNGSDIGIIDSLVIFTRNVFLTGCLFIITLVDIEIQEVPDGCILAGVIAFVLTTPFAYNLSGEDSLWRFILFRLVAAAGTLLLMLGITFLVEKIVKRDAMGGGDIKLYAMMALYLGAVGSYELVMFSSILGIVCVMVRKAVKPDAPRELPFAPSITAAAYVLLIFSETITNWYLGLLG